MAVMHKVAAVGVALWVLSGAALAEEWKLAKDKDGVQVYLSEVPGSQYKAYKGITLIKADMNQLLDLQADVKNACKWIHECRLQKTLKQEDGHRWTYTQFNTPWPVTARDSIMEVSTEHLADGKVVRKLVGLPKYLPEEKGFVRVTKIDGTWTFTPKANGEIETVYQLHTEPGGSVPGWLANSFVVDAPFNTLKQFRDLAEKR